MRFAKYHGLGNDYIVLDPADVGRDLTPKEIRQICHRNYGVGSDGILLCRGARHRARTRLLYITRSRLLSSVTELRKET